MSQIPVATIITRLREIVQDGLGSVRAIDAARFQGDLPDGLTPEEQARRGIQAEAPIEVSLTRLRPHPQQLTQAGGAQVWLVTVELRVIRTLPIDAQVDDDTRDAVRAAAVLDGNAIADALRWPGNLAQTSDGIDTGMIGAVFIESRLSASGTAGEAMRLETIHTFDITCKSAPAVA